MNVNPKETLVLAGISAAMLGLAASFLLNAWGNVRPPTTVPPTPPEFTNTATIRMSAKQLIDSGEDASGLSCSSCHDENKPVVVKLDAKGGILLSEAHKDILIQHGQSSRNDHCFNCHNPRNLEELRAREGQSFKLTDSNPLCGSCHGPTFRAWEQGLHGRFTGFWDTTKGKRVREDCTSCHNPHTPRFPSIKAGPAPYPRYFESAQDKPAANPH